MLRRIQASLHLKLILAFSLVMLLPTLAIALYTLSRIETVLISRISADQLRLATARAATVESQIAEAGADLLVLLQSQALHHYAHGQPGAEVELSESFQRFLAGSFGRYSAICMLEVSGRERICVRASPAGYALAPADQLRSRHATPAFISAMRQSAIPSARPLAITGGDLSFAGPPQIAYSLRLSDDEANLVGVLVIEAPVVNLLADLTDPEPGVITTVINSTGAYIFTSDRDLLAQDTPGMSLSQTHPSTAETMLRQPAGVIIDAPDRPGRFLVFTRIRPTSQSAVHWTVIYERSMTSITSTVHETRAVIISLTALALASLLASGIVRPIRALGRLAGGLAHDFNNLLTGILGEVDLLLFDLPLDSPLRPSADQIRGSGTRAATLTSQLLAFSRRQVLQTELLSLNTVIGEIAQMLRRLIGEHILLSMSLDPHLPLVRADPGQIQQVVMNLAINARDAMPGGGMLRIATAGLVVNDVPEAQHSGVAPGRYVLLSVSDTGAGIDEQSRDHIFEPFFTTKDRGKGTGLGLATVHGIVRQSGGQISFESSPGRGTAFRIYLPAVTDADAAAHATVEPLHAGEPPSAKLSGTVLLAEDDDGVRALASQILARQGFTVLTASDGHAALALARDYQGPIQLLLTDVVMPGGLNGVQLAAALSASRPQLRVLYMSGYTDNALIEHSLSEHGAGYIQKPFTPDALARALIAVLA